MVDAMSDIVIGDNRLPLLAAEIRTAHEGVLSAAKTAAERAIEAGRALIEAKTLVGHGRWGKWLRENCGIPERTAQLYMKIVKLGFNSATVAEIGVRVAGEASAVIRDDSYDPFAHCVPDAKRDWLLFCLFLVRHHRFKPEGAWAHTEWILQHQFSTPCEWLGAEGASFRAQCAQYRNTRPSAELVRHWEQFKTEGRERTFESVSSELFQ